MALDWPDEIGTALATTSLKQMKSGTIVQQSHPGYNQPNWRYILVGGSEKVIKFSHVYIALTNENGVDFIWFKQIALRVLARILTFWSRRTEIALVPPRYGVSG